jgi:hypothetical protein
MALALVLSATNVNGATAKYYIEGVVICDSQVVTNPNLAYCRSISGGDASGLLYAIDVTKKDRPVVVLDGLMKVDPIGHMKILEISDRAARMGYECTQLLVENDVITWAWAKPIVNCLKERKIAPTLK